MNIKLHSSLFIILLSSRNWPELSAKKTKNEKKQKKTDSEEKKKKKK